MRILGLLLIPALLLGKPIEEKPASPSQYPKEIKAKLKKAKKVKLKSQPEAEAPPAPPVY
ncbi:MAG: hypothetical protein ACKN9V_05480 [Pseudomonadota bacterium]